MEHIMTGYITSQGVCKICDDIEKYTKSGEIVKNAKIRTEIAERIVLAEKEQIRYDLILHYGMQYGTPCICDIADRDALVEAYIAAGYHDGYDTAEFIAQKLLEDKRIANWVESIGADIFDNERYLADPVAFERQARAEAVYDE